MNSDNIIAKEYGKYCKLNTAGTSLSSDNSEEKFEIFNTSKSLGFDVIKLYFVSGYDFSDIFAGLLRLSVPRNDGKFLDLCNFIYTKGIVHKYIKFMTKPIIFGNFIYDKYIEIAVPSRHLLGAAWEGGSLSVDSGGSYPMASGPKPQGSS